MAVPLGRPLPRLSDYRGTSAGSTDLTWEESHRATEEWAKRLVEDLYQRLLAIGDALRVVAAFVSTDTVQSIPNNAATALSFTSPINRDPWIQESWKSVWNAATPGKFTISERGWYFIGGCVELAAAPGATQNILGIKVNGQLLTEQGGNFATGQNGRLNIVTLYAASVGDVFTLEVYQNSGGALNTLIHDITPNMWIRKVG